MSDNFLGFYWPVLFRHALLFAEFLSHLENRYYC
jgi:hypothetical protein